MAWVAVLVSAGVEPAVCCSEPEQFVLVLALVPVVLLQAAMVFHFVQVELVARLVLLAQVELVLASEQVVL